MSKIKAAETIVVKNPGELPNAAEALLDFKEDYKIFALYGAMGAGKTSFVKAFCNKLGVKDKVSSPTFSIVNEYLSGDNNSIYHFDFYRIKRESEAYDLGLEDYIYSGNICLIEWPEKISGLLPEKHIRVEIVEDNKGYRTITFQK